MSSSKIKMEEQNSDAIHETRNWTALPSMITPRYHFGATAIGEKIYIAGGRKRNDGSLSSAEIFDSKSNECIPLPDMKEKRSGCAVVSVNGKVYIFGRDDDKRYIVSGEMFDPATNKWTPIPGMKKDRAYFAACTIGNKIYVIGGHNNYIPCSLVEVFDTATQKWSPLPHMKTKRNGCAAVSTKNKIYVFGGLSGRDPVTSTYFSSAEVYDVITQKWTQLPEMKHKRVGCKASVVGNTIYIVGGRDDIGCLSSSEVFNISTNTWSSSIIPDMNEKRCGCQAVSIGPSIYVMGGENDAVVTSSVQVLEINTNKLIPPREENDCMKTCSNLIESSKGDGNEKAMNDNNDDDQSATRSHAFAYFRTSKNDPTNPSFVTIHQRVLFMEESVGLKHDSSAVLLKRIKFLETNICDDSQNSGNALTERVDNLEVSFFGKKRKLND